MKIRWYKLRHPLTLVVLLGVILRIYYAFIANGQALWWDEAVYGNMARYWNGGLYWEFGAARPVLFSFLWSIFNLFSRTEFLPRLLILICSIAAIIGMFRLGKSLSGDRRIALAASFFTSIFYIHIFYTQRLLVDTLSFTFFIWSAYYFYEYFKKETPKLFYIACIITAIGFLFRITTALILFVVLIYILLLETKTFYKKKEYWIGALIFFLIISPYFIWGYFQFDGFVLTQAFETNAPKNFWVGGYNVLMDYVMKYFILIPNVWAIPLFLLFVLGLLMMHEAIVGLDMAKKGDKKIRRDLFLLLLFIIPTICISFLLDHYEDRYIFNAFPAIFILASIAFVYLIDLIAKKNKSAGGIFAIAILIIIFISQIQAVDFTVKGKVESYREVQQAGLWIKAHSNPQDVVVTHSYPQIQYYSERYCQFFPKTEEEFEEMDDTNFTYFVLSVFERSPEWVYQYPTKKNLTVAQAYLTTDNQPILVIYNLK
jgi:4-amino-4-deoxy-L-arabinose transferase-like glycosyltransferase